MEQGSLHQGLGTLAHVGFHLPQPPHLPWLASCLPVSPSLTPSTLDPTLPFLPSPQDSDWVMSAEQTHRAPLLPSAHGEGQDAGAGRVGLGNIALCHLQGGCGNTPPL